MKKCLSLLLITSVTLQSSASTWELVHTDSKFLQVLPADLRSSISSTLLGSPILDVASLSKTEDSGDNPFVALTKDGLYGMQKGQMGYLHCGTGGGLPAPLNEDEANGALEISTTVANDKDYILLQRGQALYLYRLDRRELNAKEITALKSASGFKSVSNWASSLVSKSTSVQELVAVQDQYNPNKTFDITMVERLVVPEVNKVVPDGNKFWLLLNPKTRNELQLEGNEQNNHVGLVSINKNGRFLNGFISTSSTGLKGTDYEKTGIKFLTPLAAQKYLLGNDTKVTLVDQFGKRNAKALQIFDVQPHLISAAGYLLSQSRTVQEFQKAIQEMTGRDSQSPVVCGNGNFIVTSEKIDSVEGNSYQIYKVGCNGWLVDYAHFKTAFDAKVFMKDGNICVTDKAGLMKVITPVDPYRTGNGHEFSARFFSDNNFSVQTLTEFSNTSSVQKQLQTTSTNKSSLYSEIDLGDGFPSQT